MIVTQVRSCHNDTVYPSLTIDPVPAIIRETSLAVTLELTQRRNRINASNVTKPSHIIATPAPI